MEKFYSNGKLLITGEYVVLDGALSFALPTTFGQDLEVCELDQPVIIWESFSVLEELWFQAEIKIADFHLESNNPMEATLKKIILEAKKLNPSFLANGKGAFVQTHLNFPNDWGLGTSSTLINNIASWAKVNAFELLNKSFGGSGYDIACAQNNSPIYYQIENKIPKIEKVVFDPSFKENLFFVHLNQKQNSKEGIQAYKSLKIDKSVFREAVSEISKKIVHATNVTDFEKALNEHEKLISELLQIPTVKQRLFPDYFGAIKSLGAWGGDFVLATGNEHTMDYFESKGYSTLLTYKEMILSF